jgi:release factor glutamine methyltransferase
MAGKDQPMSQTLGEALKSATAQLATARCDSPRLEAELLLCEATGASRTELIAWPDRPLTPSQAKQLANLIRRRAGGEPIAYILGYREFWGLCLRVTPDTLIPRHETELLVEATLAALPAEQPLVGIDLGTGCGAVAIALASERPRWTLIASDRSGPALHVAADNARTLGLGNLLPLQADWLTAIADEALHFIVCNPPYIHAADPHLHLGDPRHEPRMALTDDADGTTPARTIARQGRRCLHPGGWIAFEHGWDQGPTARQLLNARGYHRVQTLRDLAGHDRVTCGYT